MNIVATDIVYDIDSEDNVIDELALPSEMNIPFSVFVEGLDSVTDYISDETGFCICEFNLEDKSDTYVYVVDFLYVSDKSSLSANIPDTSGCQCIVESDIDLEEIPISKLKENYQIQEILEANDCESITLIREDNLNEISLLLNDIYYLVINKEDLDLDEEKEM